MLGLSTRENDLVDVIRRLTVELNQPPSYQEMRLAMGLKSVGGVAKILDQLEIKGAIHKRPSSVSKAVRLTGDAERKRKITSESVAHDVLFYRLHNGWTIAQVLKDFGLSTDNLETAAACELIADQWLEGRRPG